MNKLVLKYYPGIILFTACVLLSVFTLPHYGVSWDEPAQRLIGNMSYNYVFHNDTSLFTFADKEYGTGFELPLMILEKKANITDTRTLYMVRHIITHIFFLVSVLCGYVLAFRLFGSKSLAILAFVMLAFAPRLYAHSFFNSKDIPFLSAILISFAICQWAFSSQKKYVFLLLGISAGYFTSIRLLGIIPAGIMAVFMVIDIATAYAKQRTWKNEAIHLLLFTIGFATCLYVAWPFLWPHPVQNLIHCFSNMTGKVFPPPKLLTEFMQLSVSAKLWLYLPVWFCITIPPVWLILGLTGVVWAVFTVAKAPKEYISNTNSRQIALYFFSFSIPVILVMNAHSLSYDDWRHMYFIYPFFVFIALFALNKLLHTKLKTLVTSLCALQVAGIGWFMVNNHPFEQVYFNSLIKHKDNFLRNNFDLDYWGVSAYQAIQHLVTDIPNGEIKIHDPGFEVYVVNNIDFMPQQDRARIKTGSMEESDYFITNHRFHTADYDYPIVYSRQVYGNTIICVYKLK